VKHKSVNLKGNLILNGKFNGELKGEIRGFTAYDLP
jgi:hypothetical protein